MNNVGIDEHHVNDIDRAITYITSYCKQFGNCNGCELYHNGCYQCTLLDMCPNIYDIDIIKNKTLQSKLQVLKSYCINRECEDCTIALTTGYKCVHKKCFWSWQEYRKRFLALCSK